MDEKASPRLALGLALGVKGVEGGFSRRFNTPSSRWRLVMESLEVPFDKEKISQALFEANLKINRANHHIREAQALFEGYTKTDFCEILEERNPETGAQDFRAVAKPIPAGLVLAIGDAFHNLNVSFDYMMTGMMRAAGRDTGRIHFPSHETRDGLRKSFMAPKDPTKLPANRRIVKTFPAFARVLLNRIKPYRGGNFYVWEIRRADNTDKHNLILPTVKIVQLRGVHFFDESHNNSVRMDMSLPPGGRLELLRYGCGVDGVKITAKGNPTLAITFPDGSEIFAGNPVFPTLTQCAQAAHRVRECVERFCAAL